MCDTVREMSSIISPYSGLLWPGLLFLLGNPYVVSECSTGSSPQESLNPFAAAVVATSIWPENLVGSKVIDGFAYIWLDNISACIWSVLDLGPELECKLAAVDCLLLCPLVLDASLGQNRFLCTGNVISLDRSVRACNREHTRQHIAYKQHACSAPHVTHHILCLVPLVWHHLHI